MWPPLIPAVLNTLAFWNVSVALNAAPILGTNALYAAERRQMVDLQLNAPGRDIRSPAVLAAMATVPRHEFVPAAMQSAAYGDYPLPIGYGQTISQPYIVAFMTERLELKPTERVLEIGTGSGYQAAVLAHLVAEVYSIEIIEALAHQAASTLTRLGYQNVQIKVGDGFQGWPEHAPFDAIIVTCAPERVPQPLVDQLKEGGRMIIPVGELRDQSLYFLEKRNGTIKKRAVLPVRFVPMTGPGRASTLHPN
jgi:protein-L-isoaspartate(D-aspartate) O-methyltransferase